MGRRNGGGCSLRRCELFLDDAGHRSPGWPPPQPLLQTPPCTQKKASIEHASAQCVTTDCLRYDASQERLQMLMPLRFGAECTLALQKLPCHEWRLLDPNYSTCRTLNVSEASTCDSRRGPAHEVACCAALQLTRHGQKVSCFLLGLLLLWPLLNVALIMDSAGCMTSEACSYCAPRLLALARLPGKAKRSLQESFGN